MDNTMLDVIVGLVFIYLLFSVLLTSLSDQVVNNLFKLRGKNLEVAVKSAFGASDNKDPTADAAAQKFFDSGLIASLFEGKRKPSAIPPDVFAKAYPYHADDGREDLGAGDDISRVVRGGSWYDVRLNARCAYRFGFPPDDRLSGLGFRVVLRSAPDA